MDREGSVARRGGPRAAAAYRNYFCTKKKHLARWPLLKTPKWFTGDVLPPYKTELARIAKRRAYKSRANGIRKRRLEA